MPLSPESVLPGRGILDREEVPAQPKTLEALAAENIRLDRLARSRLRILDSISEGIYQVDSNGNCVFMNRAACYMFGYDFGEAIGKNMHELHHGKDFNPAFREEECAIHGQHSRLITQKPIEDVFRSTDGFTFPVECCSHAVFEKGAQRGSVISFRNIAERKNLERRMLAQRAVSRALEETASTEILIPLLIRTLGESLGFSWGVLWRLDERAGVLRLAHHWCVSSALFEQFVETCRQSTFTAGQDLPGKVWETDEPIWLSDIDPAQAAHVKAVRETGFKCGFAMPIRMTKGLFGVLELLALERMPSDPELFDVLRLVGSAMGQVLERKRSEDVRTRLATILDAGTEFAGVVFDAAGTVVSVSRAVKGIFGFEPTELVGKPLETIIPNYRVSLQESGWDEELHPNGAPGRAIRMQGRRRSGKTVPLDVSFGECLEGGSRVIAGIILDITERIATQEMLDRQAEDLRRSEEALRYQTQLINSIVASMADGVIAVDAAADVVLYNPAATKLLGEPVETSLLLRDEVADSPFGAFLPDQTTPIEWADMPLLRAVRGEVVDSVEMFVRPAHRPEGFWLNGAARPMIGNDGVLRGGVLVFRDISEQKASREALRQAKEEAEAANRAKSEFLSRMSHELRTPMNAILGFAQLLEDEELRPEHRDPIERILKAARHLLTLINEVLDISRIEAGRLQIQIGPVQAREVLQSALELMGPLAAQRQVELAPLSTRDTQWVVNADRQSLTQIVVNLLANAVKYNRQHGSVRVWFEEVPEQRLRISIADTGRGLSPEQLRKLFTPFERLGAERTGIEGTGLGLAYSNRLANAMGAIIGVDSELEKGSTFWIEMPLNTSGQAEGSFRTESSPRNAMMANVDMGVTRILCIQDDPDSLRAIEEVIERLPGYAFMPANTAAMGIQITQTQGPELILLDLDIPDMHGMEALRALRAGSGARQIPVVVLSGNITEELKKKVRDAGGHACIGKPIQVTDLVDTVACLV